MQQDLIEARIEDCVSLCRKTEAPKYLGFLSAAETEFARNLKILSGVNHGFSGGFDLAERRILGVFPEWMSEPRFPVSAITFTYPVVYKLTHRDFLGAIMSLKISRESVGDILVGEGKAVVFVTDYVAPHILSEINKVGSVGVKGERGLPDVLPELSEKIFLNGTVASSRLDCVVAALANTSRAHAAELIENGFVTINSGLCQKVTRAVNVGETVTVRGKGRFTVEDLSCRTKKGRTVLKYSKFA